MENFFLNFFEGSHKYHLILGCCKIGVIFINNKIDFEPLISEIFDFSPLIHRSVTHSYLKYFFQKCLAAL